MMKPMGKVSPLVGPPDDEYGDDEEMADDGDDAEGDMQSAKVDAMKDYRAALKTGTDEEALASLEALLDIIG